jgi:hypothetical protein
MSNTDLYTHVKIKVWKKWASSQCSSKWILFVPMQYVTDEDDDDVFRQIRRMNVYYFDNKK